MLTVKKIETKVLSAYSVRKISIISASKVSNSKSDYNFHFSRFFSVWLTSKTLKTHGLGLELFISRHNKLNISHEP